MWNSMFELGLVLPITSNKNGGEGADEPKGLDGPSLSRLHATYKFSKLVSMHFSKEL